jgi:hypothetical protein
MYTYKYEIPSIAAAGLSGWTRGGAVETLHPSYWAICIVVEFVQCSVSKCKPKAKQTAKQFLKGRVEG